MNRTSWISCCVGVLAIVLTASVAGAQTGGGTEPPGGGTAAGSATTPTASSQPAPPSTASTANSTPAPSRVPDSASAGSVAQAPGSAYTPPPVEDGMRLRGGMSLNGGFMTAFEPSNVLGGAVGIGGTIGLAARLGIQFNHLLGLYYQASPQLGFYTVGTTGLVSASLFNSVLASLTFGDFFEVAAGPSIDVVGLFGCSLAAMECAQNGGMGLGAHARLGIFVSGRSGIRRTGFNIGVDLHPIFLFGGVILFTATAGIGVEWY